MTVPISRVCQVFVIAVLALGSLAACGAGNGYQSYNGKRLSLADIQGHYTSNCAATMELRSGGAAVVAGYPRDGNQNDRYSGGAIWILDEGSGWRSETNPPLLQLKVGGFLDSLNLASVKSGAGFALQMGGADTGGFCIFSRS